MSDEVRRTPSGIPLRIGTILLIKEGKDHNRFSNPTGNVAVLVVEWYGNEDEQKFVSHEFGNNYWYSFDEVLKNLSIEKRKENFVNKKRKSVLNIFQYSPK